ncbi:hypothetical protein D3C71_1536380 [compost metagenome]
MPCTCTSSSPWFRRRFFCPCTTRLPLGRRCTTVTVTLPCRRLLCALLPLPVKSRAPLAVALRMSLPPRVTGAPRIDGVPRLRFDSLLVAVLALVCAVVFSSRVMVSRSPTSRARRSEYSCRVGPAA